MDLCRDRQCRIDEARQPIPQLPPDAKPDDVMLEVEQSGSGLPGVGLTLSGRAHAFAKYPESQRRATTRSGVLTGIVTVSVAFVAGLMVLRELSIDVMPILTGAGIA